ncbi:hypothetical protein HU200_062738 [Digitaria exilis]|uniref:Uncharacterized protein n=1 Tax=Digitaria exilis TaxID=1010633 RepID=A0A835A2S0_9POAL|nr:hypothetical protein HU200_062738 [Digitaria exilis]
MVLQLRDMKRPGTKPKEYRNNRTSKRSSHYSMEPPLKPLPLAPHRSLHSMNTKQMSLEKLRPPPFS